MKLNNDGWFDLNLIYDSDTNKKEARGFVLSEYKHYKAWWIRDQVSTG